MRYLRNFEDYQEPEENLELKQQIREYLLTNYPSDWWNNEFVNRVYDYIDEDDLIGYGTEENPDYKDEENAYRHLSTGGAIEYDLLDEIGKDIQKHFNISEKDYFDRDFDEVVEEHMTNMIDWYDKFVFGPNKHDPFGFNKGVENLMKSFDNLPNETDDGVKI